MDAWHALQRSSVDAALLSSSEANVFAFAEGCFYFAMVYYSQSYVTGLVKLREREEKKQQQAVGPLRLKKRTQTQSSAWKPISGWNDTGHSGTATQPDWQDQDHDMEALTGDEIQKSPWSKWGNEHVDESDFPSLFGIDAHNHSVDPFSVPKPLFSGANAPMDSIPSIDDTSESDSEMESGLIGIAYIAPATGLVAEASREVSMGVALLPHARGKGFGSETTRELVKIAIDKLSFHRVTALVLGRTPTSSYQPSQRKACSENEKKGEKQQDSLQPPKHDTEAEVEAVLRMFIAAGFNFEGTRRRSLLEANGNDNSAWRDTHCLAILDTDWMEIQMRAMFAAIHPGDKGKEKAREQDGSSSSVNEGKTMRVERRRTRWDEMLPRHQREQEALARVESRLHRSASTETLRPDTGPGAKTEANIIEIGGGYLSSDTNESDYGNDVERASVFSSTSISNPFRDPTSGGTSTFRSQSRFFLDSGDESADEEGGNLELEQGSQNGSELSYPYLAHARFEQADNVSETLSREKVAQFLRTLTQPGPPPSEIEVVSSAGSDFESCVDEAESSSGAEEKASTDDPLELGGNSGTRPTLTSAPFMVPSTPTNTMPESALEVSQARKKRRLSLDSEAVGDKTSGPGDGPDDTPNLSTSFPRTGSWTSVTRDASTDTDTDTEMHSDVEVSDAESASTSTWDVLSGTSSVHTPSPSPSLHSASDDEALI